jgi:A/G-specific adenine glycosylase
MLHQTTVQPVPPYFDRFIKAFPTIQALAEAEPDTVNRLWEGLGYYRRCTLLHKAARFIAAQYGGVFPDDYQTVRQLPGIGRYTAGAVLSIAFDQRFPILEANTLRLHARLLALRGDIRRGKANENLWKFAEAILPASGSGKINQALMDLGSIICTPKKPQCTACPAAAFCQSAKQGLQELIPEAPPKETTEYRIEAAFLIRKKKKVLLIRYPEGVRWAGLWDFPRTEAGVRLPLELPHDLTLQKKIAEMTGRKILPGRLIASCKHSVTKYRITLFFCEGLDAGKSGSPLYETRWVTAEELQQLPMNSTARKLAQTAVLML